MFLQQSRLRRVIVIACAILAASTASFVARAQTKTPISHETMWLLKRVGAPTPSPDGKWVVFSLTEPAYDEKDQVSDLWIVPTDASAKPRRLTFTKGGESGVTWSPDSKRLAFSARREGDEVAQIYIIDVADGGEAVRVTSLSTGARSPEWRPDGKVLLFTSTVFPGAADDDANKKMAAERKAQKYRARVYERFPIRNWDKWLEDTQGHLFVQSLDPGAKAKDLFAETKIAKEPGFSGRLTDAGEEFDAVWTPDGESIVFVATTVRNAAAYAPVNNSLFRIAAKGGEPVRLTEGKDSFARPTFSPDGRGLYAISTIESNGKVYNLDRLAKFSWPNMGVLRNPIILTKDFDRSVGAYALTPDSRSIYLLAEEAGNEKLYTLPADGGEVRLAMDMTRGVYTNLRIPRKAASTILIASWESAMNPPEIFRLDLTDRTQKPLTQFNAERLAQIDWQPLRHFWFTSSRGKRIHNMIRCRRDSTPIRSIRYWF